MEDWSPEPRTGREPRPATGGILGQAPHVDPFHASTTNEAAADLSDELLKRLQAEGIEALISAVGNQGLEILYKLHLKGLHTVCIPRSIENDIVSTAMSSASTPL